MRFEIPPLILIFFRNLGVDSNRRSSSFAVSDQRRQIYSGIKEMAQGDSNQYETIEKGTLHTLNYRLYISKSYSFHVL